MRVLAATIGALLISVSHTALAQEFPGGTPRGALQQGEMAQADMQRPAMPEAHQDEPRQGEREHPLAQRGLGEEPSTQAPAMEAEELLARLPERDVTERPAVQEPEMDAEELLAQLPERDLGVQGAATETGDRLAQAPERGMAEPPATQGTAMEIEMRLARLTGRRTEEQPAAPEPELSAEEILAQLPQRELVERPAMPEPATEAETILAQLPERELVEQLKMTAEELLARLPDPGRPAARPAMSAKELPAQLPDLQQGERAVTMQPAMSAEELLAALPDPQAEDQAEELRRPEAMKAGMQDQPAAMEMPQDPKWTALNERGLGTTVDMPRAVFAKADGAAHKNVGRRYATADGRAKVSVWTQRAARNDTPANYLRRTFKIPRATLDYERFTPEFAAVSGVYGGRVYYIRCNLSPRGYLHCFDLAYPVREKKAWDVVVARMSHSLRPLYY